MNAGRSESVQKVTGTLPTPTAYSVLAERKSRRKGRPRHRPRARHYQRANGRCGKSKALFEYVGQHYDDVLVTLEYDKRVVAAIRALPRWARHWDATSNIWRIHPGYAERLAAALIHLGYTVWTITEAQIVPGKGNAGLPARPGSLQSQGLRC
jgi:hypothetical protein